MKRERARGLGTCEGLEQQQGKSEHTGSPALTSGTENKKGLTNKRDEKWLVI